jgi:hypothetical protein
MLKWGPDKYYINNKQGLKPHKISPNSKVAVEACADFPTSLRLRLAVIIIDAAVR